MRLRNIPRAEAILEAHDKVIQNGEQWKGNWRQVFGNDNPIHIEIGMGKGQFLSALAKRSLDVNFIGIERYSSVLLRGVERFDEEEQEILNLRFICMDAAELEQVFAPGEVEQIYLNFSDPWPKKKHARRRLTSAEFLSRYENVLAEGGVVEFKTDNRELFCFSLEQVEQAGWKLYASSFDLHQDNELNVGNVMTEYEQKFSGMGKPIYKLITVRTGKERAGSA